MAPQLTLMSGLSAAQGAVVDGPGNELLARAGLAKEQDGRVRARDLLDGSQQGLHRRARAQDVTGTVRLVNLVLKALVLEREPLAPPLRPLDQDGILDGDRRLGSEDAEGEKLVHLPGLPPEDPEHAFELSVEQEWVPGVGL